MKLCNTAQVISGAGHHLYADKPKIFNQIVNEACDLTDKNHLSSTPNLSTSEIKAKEDISGFEEEINDTEDSNQKPQPVTD